MDLAVAEGSAEDIQDFCISDSQNGKIGGVSTYSIVYEHIIENGYFMKLESDCFVKGSLIEPASCVLRGNTQDGVTLIFSNSTDGAELVALAGGEFDDVFVYAPVPAVVELSDEIQGFDGFPNFFAGKRQVLAHCTRNP